MRKLLMVAVRRWTPFATLLAVMLMTAAGASAQESVKLSTRYPAVAVEAGENHSFPLKVTGPDGTRVDLSVDAVPEGWNATLRGGGFVLDGVIVDAQDPPEVLLDVTVPHAAAEGTYQVVVSARGPDGAVTLPVDLRVAQAVAGNISLEAEFPSLRGSADSTFTFNLDLANNTPEETTFTLEAAGPRGWSRPSPGRRRAPSTRRPRPCC